MITPDSEILRSDINPTVFTARAALMGGAASGDKDAMRMMELVSNDMRSLERRGFVHESRQEKIYSISKAYGTAAWIRSKISEKMFEALRMMTFVDLGCGISSRGMSFMKKGYIQYYGIDLPPVIERMKRLVVPVGESADKIRYFAADVTDLSALRALIKSSEPVFIVTEGLMPYLTESEMKTVMENIASLLAELGGVWFTGDTEERSVYGRIMKQMFGYDEEALKGVIGSELSEQWQKLYVNNSFMTLKGSDFDGFLMQYGLTRRKVSTDTMLKEMRMPDPIREAFASTKFLAITPQETDTSKRAKASRAPFRIETEREPGKITFRINGRLDSVNAPGLVEEFDDKCSPDKENLVILDLAECSYISSAGIRALLMIHKKNKKGKNVMNLVNIRPEVLEILSTTGFDNFM